MLRPRRRSRACFNVDTTKDGNDGECSNDCTLREAVNLSTAQGNSIALPAGVYKLTLGELVLRNNTTIVGAGIGASTSAGSRTTIIDAQGRSRVVDVPANTGAIVAGVTLTGGRAANGAGALVGNNGSLQLINTAVDENVATGRGGGVHAPAGSIALSNSIVSRNRAASGGGIALDLQGVLVSFASTISGNTASGPGGGITSLGNMTLQNVTIANNTASSGGGVFIEPGGSSGGDAVNNTIISGAGTGGACGGGFAADAALRVDRQHRRRRDVQLRRRRGPVEPRPTARSAQEQPRPDRHDGAPGRQPGDQHRRREPLLRQ